MFQERPNALSTGWTRGVETVPSYEQAPNDAHAIAYRITHKSSLETYRLYSDVTHEAFAINEIDDSKKPKKGVEKSIEVTKYGSDGEPGSSFANISGILRNKINLKQKEPRVKVASRHGEISVLLFKGNYCGFKHTSQEIEYYWQLRYHPKITVEKGSAQFKDAILRRTVKGQLSSICALYVPFVQSEHAQDSASTMSPCRAEAEKDLGRLLMRTELNEFDREMALMSFVVILLRVIEAEKKRPFASGLINALTVGAT